MSAGAFGPCYNLFQTILSSNRRPYPPRTALVTDVAFSRGSDIRRRFGVRMVRPRISAEHQHEHAKTEHISPSVAGRGLRLDRVLERHVCERVRLHDRLAKRWCYDDCNRQATKLCIDA